MTLKADVLIVTATPVESRAVIDTFTGLTGQPPHPVPVDDRVYHDLGKINGASVFLALSEMGAGGLGGAQLTVQKGIAALRPAAVIMVGIAFGVNEQKQAIGDVLVSQQLLLYESQRLGEGKIILRGDKPHASTKLINYIESARLYWKESSITVRMGLILSGEKLVDSLDYREQLRQFAPEAIGGEMEGAGLYVACQDAKADWILVKAICDWADGHKAQDQDARQLLAAHNAAAFVAHALNHTVVPIHSPNEVMQLQKCMNNIFATEDDLRGFCLDNFEEIYRNLKEIDRRPHITREIIMYCKSRGTTDALWDLLRQQSLNITNNYRK